MQWHTFDLQMSFGDIFPNHYLSDRRQKWFIFCKIHNASQYTSHCLFQIYWRRFREKTLIFLICHSIFAFATIICPQDIRSSTLHDIALTSPSPCLHPIDQVFDSIGNIMYREIIYWDNVLYLWNSDLKSALYINTIFDLSWPAGTLFLLSINTMLINTIFVPEWIIG